MSEVTEWVLSELASEGFAPLEGGDVSPFSQVSGFVVLEDQSGAAQVKVSAAYRGQDKYEQWSEAQALANKLMDVLESSGEGFEEVQGSEPNVSFLVFNYGIEGM